MRKEISARTCADYARNQPACKQRKPSDLVRFEKPNQTRNCEQPQYRLASRERCKCPPAVFKSLRRRNSANVLQVMCEDILYKIAQATVGEEVQDDEAQYR